MKEIKVTDRTPGYHHTELRGTCSDDVTVRDIEKRFYDPHLWGRNATVHGGGWSCIVHTD